MVGSGIESLLENLEQLNTSEFSYVFTARDVIDSILKDLSMLSGFLKQSEEEGYHEQKKVNELISEIVEIVDETADVIDFVVVSTFSKNRRRITEKILHFLYPNRRLRNVRKKLGTLVKAVANIHVENLGSTVALPCQGASQGSASRQTLSDSVEEIMVGFGEELHMLKDQLTAVTVASRQLKVVSIVGMAGLGKTTLAKKLYNDPYIVHYFYVRSWTSVSQLYRKREVLLEMLSSHVERKDELENMNDENLVVTLYKRLKDRRYLIVIDDIWNIEVWNELKKIFPNDRNGSRVLFTTRENEVATLAKAETCPYFLRFLSADESWELLQKKTFGEESCPQELMQLGRRIVEKCGGLPLVIVVIAGLLSKTSKTKEWWEQIAERVSSHMTETLSGCSDTLALSYNHLPNHLRPCFLYLGAFPEGQEISVKKLIWLWIAEGFILNIEEKNLEDIAEKYLMDLIDRSLVLVAKRRSSGQIKACRVHDLVRDWCLKKAVEENFVQRIKRCEENFFVSPSRPSKNFLCFPSNFFNPLILFPWRSSTQTKFESEIYGCKHRRLCVHFSYSFSTSSNLTVSKQPCWICHSNCVYLQKPTVPRVRSFLCLAIDQCKLSHLVPLGYSAFKYLRVLDLAAIRVSDLPKDVQYLVLLRYLAFRAKTLSSSSSTLPIWSLCSLETLVVLETRGLEIPQSIFRDMKKLRHLNIGGETTFGPLWDPYIPKLENLQTLSHIRPRDYSSWVFHKTPNLRKLTFCGNFSSENGVYELPQIDFLNKLETLKLLSRHKSAGFNLQLPKFPPSLKRLTLSLTYLDWKDMSIIGLLPMLEVLKLEYQACIGTRWDTSDGGFRQLKFLKFCYMNIEKWNATSTQFPLLQRLVLQHCEKLKTVPSDLGDIPTLHTIDLSWCSQSAVRSVQQIHEEQLFKGNDTLKISVHPPDLLPCGNNAEPERSKAVTAPNVEVAIVEEAS